MILFRQRVFPVLVVYTLSLLPMAMGVNYFYILDNVIEILDKPQRQTFIWITTFFICGSHYWFVTRKRPNKMTFIFKVSNVLINLVLTLSTLGLVVNSSVNLIVGLGKELQLPGSFFTKPTLIDSYSITGGVLVVLVWCFFEYEKMILETFKDKKDVLATSNDRSENKEVPS